MKIGNNKKYKEDVIKFINNLSAGNFYIIPIMDIICLKEFINNGRVNGNKTQEKWLCKNIYIKNYILNRYNDSKSIVETLYRIQHKIEIRPICKGCGKEINFDRHLKRFKSFCSNKCASNDEEEREKRRKTCLEKYGVENPFSSDYIKEKIKKINKEKYGYSSASKNSIIKEKTRITCLNKYGTICYSLSEEYKNKYKQTCLEKYGVENYSQTNEFKSLFNNDVWLKNKIEKSNNTKKKNKTFNTSKSELEIYNIIKEQYSDVVYQYKDKRYPFICDYYIPSLDLFIEYNGHWSHNNHSFNSNDENDINILEKWQEKAKTSNFYKKAIEVWTKRDVAKIKKAKKNKLNYLIIWFKDYTKNDIINKIKKKVFNYE